MFSFTAPQVNEEQLQAELAAMTEEERDAVYRDLYGKEERLDEEQMTAKKVESAVAQMQTEINSMRIKRGYNLAMEKCPDLVQKLFVEFLSSTRYEPKPAASKMVHYWDIKKDLFGDSEAFCKDKITLDDLNEQDRESLYRSVFMKLPCKDRHGRPILFSTRQGWVFAKGNNMRRAMWYMCQTFRDDPASTVRGAVIIAFDKGTFDMAKANRKLDMQVPKLIKNYPVRWVAMHHVMDSRILRMIWPMVLFLAGRKNRQRIVDHQTKNNPDWLQGFDEYGLAPQELPKSMGGSLHFDLAAWLDERKKQEQNSKRERK